MNGAAKQASRTEKKRLTRKCKKERSLSIALDVIRNVRISAKDSRVDQ